MPFDGTPVRRPEWEFTWDDAAIARLKELAATGMPASQIAEELGCSSRSAVLGKLDRLRRKQFAQERGGRGGDSGGGTQRAIAARVAREARDPKTETKTMPSPKPEPPKPKPPGHVTIIGLQKWSCRWIVNDYMAKAVYCGQPRDPNSFACYCPEHRRIAYVRSPAPRPQQYYRR